MRIATIIVVFALTLANVTSATETKSDQSNLTARICIVRPENNGFINIVPSHIIFSNNQKLSLSGGEAACIIVEPGEYSFVVESADPYPSSHKGKPKKWVSKKVAVRVKGDESITYDISPKSEGSTYTEGWDVKRIQR